MEITRLGRRKLYIFLIFEYSEIPAKPNTFGDLHLLIGMLGFIIDLLHGGLPG